MKVTTASATRTSALQVVELNKIVHQGDTFEVFEVPASMTRFTGYALLLFKWSHDFVPGKVPKGTLFIPVTVNNRQGYFIDKKVAQNFT